MTSNPLNKVLNILRNLKEDAPTNSMAGGNIAGSVEAGDDPPVKKKKRYIWTRGIRKNWKPKNESK
mgnify:CR=1 FL=1